MTAIDKNISILKLQDFSSDYFADTIAESLNADFPAIQRLADEWISKANPFDRNGEALFVAKEGDRIIGVCGLNIEPYANSATTGRVRHLYVMLWMQDLVSSSISLSKLALSVMSISKK